MRHRLFFASAVCAVLGCAAKEDPQALIDQWNKEFALKKSACERGNKESCKLACRMASEHSVCTVVQQAADLSDPNQKAWADRCIKDTLEQGRSVCPAAASTNPSGGGNNDASPRTVTAPLIASPGDAPIAPAEALPDQQLSVEQSALDTIVKGSLSKEVIRRIVRRHINEVKFCYERELAERPDLAGKVSVKFIISGTGQVQMAAVADSTLGASSVENCVAEAVRRWTFPQPEGGGIVIVTYPFEFKSR